MQETQILDIDTLGHKFVHAFNEFIKDKISSGNKTTTIESFIPVIIGGHITSMVNIFNNIAMTTNDDKIKTHLDNVMLGIEQAIAKCGYIPETYSYDMRGN